MNYVGRQGAGLLLGLMVGLLSAPHNLAAQGTLSLGGLNEGAAVTLATAANATNLSVTASLSGMTGSPNVIFWLEHHGAIIQGRTSAPPYAATFTNLASGKYFLGAYVSVDPAVSTDVSFDIVTTPLQPANDHWTNATVISNLGVSVASSNDYATREVGEPVATANSAGKTVWWRWTAISNGFFTATTFGSSFDTTLGVFTGTNLVRLSLLTANDDAGVASASFSQATFPVSAGSNYYFAVDGTVQPDGTVTQGDVQLRILATPPPFIAITAPVDGLTLMVASPISLTNTSAAVTITNVAGLTDVQYWFSGPNAARSGPLAAPYQLELTNLVVGDYWLTVMAVGSSGLITTAHAGLTVAALGGQVLLVDTPALYTNGFRLAVSARKGPRYTLQSSTNLEVWCAVTTWTNFDGVVKLTDTNIAKADRRFYRAVLQ